MNYSNPWEKKFAEFLTSNNISWEKSPEKYGDFYIPDGNILIEHKSLIKTQLTKVLDKVNHPYPGPIKYVGAISSKLDIHSYDSLKNKLIDANTKSRRAKNIKEYKNSLFIVLLSIENGWDLGIIDLLIVLNFAKFISCPFKPNQNGICDKETGEYFLVKKQANNSQSLVFLDYIGIVRKSNNLNQWKIELIQRPNNQQRNIGIFHKLGHFIDLYVATFVN